MNKEYRINGFEQIKAFYSWIFNNADKKVTPQHISLYLFLINQNNRSNWIEWFKCPFDLAMAGACIGNKRTYYLCLKELQEWGFIKYKKGTNEWRSPLIKLEVLKCTSTGTSTVPLPTPLVVPQVVPLPTPLPTHIYKLITDNIKLITDNIEDIIKNYSEVKEDKNDFSEFWDSYHGITGLKKTDMQPAQKYWKQLTKGEKEKALKNIQPYYDSLNDKKYCKKARTYLSAKSYNDELAYTSFNTAVRSFEFECQGMIQGDMKNKEHRIHPTQKPVQLYKWILTNYAKPTDKIIDTHLGSGSSAIAAHDFGVAEFVGCEIDEEYYSAAKKRFEIHTQQQQIIFK